MVGQVKVPMDAWMQSICMKVFLTTRIGSRRMPLEQLIQIVDKSILVMIINAELNSLNTDAYWYNLKF